MSLSFQTSERLSLHVTEYCGSMAQRSLEEARPVVVGEELELGMLQAGVNAAASLDFRFSSVFLLMQSYCSTRA